MNDAQNVRNFLIRKFPPPTFEFIHLEPSSPVMLGHHNYRPEDIVVLTDSSHELRFRPTRQNILDAMRWLVEGARANDALFFHCKYPGYLAVGWRSIELV